MLQYYNVSIHLANLCTRCVDFHASITTTIVVVFFITKFIRNQLRLPLEMEY